MNAKLFEYIAILQPEMDENDNPKGKAELIVHVTQVLAGEEKEVAILAARDLPEDAVDKLDRIDIVIRPF